MRFVVDSDVKAAYLYITEMVGAYERSYSSECVVDLDANGKIVGIEIVNYQGGEI